MTVIDLGELRDAHEPLPPVRPRRPARRPLLAVVLLVALVTLTASVPLPVREAVAVPFGQGADVVVAGDLLLVLDPPVRPGGPRTATAYRLPGAERVWQSTLPMRDLYWGSVPFTGLLLMSGYDPRTDDAETVAVDPGTGAHRWQQPGRALGTAGGGLLLEALNEDRSGTVRAVDPCCGTVRWEVPVPAGGPVYRASGRRVDRLVLLDPAGRVEVRDARGGHVLATADLPVPRADFGPPAQVLGELLVTNDGGRLTAYGLDRLDRRWQTTMSEVSYAMDCGDVICGHSRSDVLTAFDAATGRALWTRAGWSPVWVEESGLLVTPIDRTSGDLLDLVLLDPVSGDVRAELGRWSLVGRWAGEDPMLVVRPRTQPPGLVVAELDLAAATARVVDVLPEAARDCGSAAGLLFCQRQDGSPGLWRLPR